MEREQIAALAKGMVPFVRQCIAEQLNSATVSPDLAEQVANAVRLLHESPSIPEVKLNPVPRATPKISRIERDENGNLVPIYDEAQS